MADYDSKVIYDFAGRLYKKASTIIMLYTFIGASLGFLGGHLISDKGNLPALVCLIIFGAIGYSLGSEKACQLKLQAQTALCHAKIEENTRQ